RGRAELWDVAGRRRWLSPPLPGPVVTLAFSTDGRLLMSGGSSLQQGAVLWDVATGRRVRALLGSLKGGRLARSLFRASGRELLLACDDGRARLWNVEAD